MMRTKGISCAATIAVAACLAAPASSSATVTIGSTLASAPAVGPQCPTAGFCTYALTATEAGETAVGGLTSPVNGTVTTWRIRAGGSVGPVTFRVVRPLAGGLFTGAGTSATVTPGAGTTTPSSTLLPIAIGDQIGINCCNGAFGSYFTTQANGSNRFNNPALADNAPGRPPTVAANADAPLINADIEPTNTFTAKAKAKKGGKVKVTATLPNAGLLTVGDKKPSGGSSASAAKTPSLLVRGRVQLNGPADTSLKLKPNGKGKKVLAEDGSAKVKLRLTYTPTLGVALTKTIKIKLKD